MIVDNGSTDGTPAYLEEVSATWGRFSTCLNANGRLKTCPTRPLQQTAGQEWPAYAPSASRLSATRAIAALRPAATRRWRLPAVTTSSFSITTRWSPTAGCPGWSLASLHDWPRVGLVGPMTNYAPPPQYLPAGYRTWADSMPFAARRRREYAGKALVVERLTGFCLLARREVLERFGGFDESYGLGFFEDDDLCVRARKQAFGCWWPRTSTFIISAAAPSPPWASTPPSNSRRTSSASGPSGATSTPPDTACPAAWGRFATGLRMGGGFQPA